MVPGRGANLAACTSGRSTRNSSGVAIAHGIIHFACNLRIWKTSALQVALAFTFHRLHGDSSE